MNKRHSAKLAVALLLVVSSLWRSTLAFRPQDIASAAGGFAGQDIMGGAAVIFKRPQRMRDLVGGAGLAIVKRSKPVTHPEIARNNPHNRNNPREKPIT